MQMPRHAVMPGSYAVDAIAMDCNGCGILMGSSSQAHQCERATKALLQMQLHTISYAEVQLVYTHVLPAQ
jgi:hypothetical protein